jgi:pimeloyl-ACP methyl ester carboxylesterase
MTGAIKPFRIAISDEILADLKSRLARTRWPEAELVDDWSQGAPLRWIQEMCTYWADGYDWRAREAKLNRFEQFTTEIDGLDIHFLHMRSKEANALPLIITHGWPGSIVEFQKVIAPLADPAAHGGDPAHAFHVICPSLPGFGFSAKPKTTGWGVDRIAGTWAKLMDRLGYARYGAQGGDWGSAVTTSLGHRMRNIAPASTLRSPSTLRRRSRASRRRRKSARSLGSSTTSIWTPAIQNSSRRGRRPSAMASRIRRAGRRPGSWKNSGPGPIATATPRTSLTRMSCSITSCSIGRRRRRRRRRGSIGRVLANVARRLR